MKNSELDLVLAAATAHTLARSLALGTQNARRERMSAALFNALVDGNAHEVNDLLTICQDAALGDDDEHTALIRRASRTFARTIEAVGQDVRWSKIALGYRGALFAANAAGDGNDGSLEPVPGDDPGSAE